jgi:prephenate dehydrogenase
VSRPFDRIVIVGVGLIGGSLALAVKSGGEPPFVVGVARSPETRDLALQLGAVDVVLSPQEAGGELRTADLVVLATPVDAAVTWLEDLGRMGYEGVVTDVASTKSALFDAAERSLGPRATFIGGHPMAGSERSGLEAASADLFRDAYYVLTPSDDTDADAYRRLHTLVASLGARVIAVHPEVHDEAVAAISHVPHVAASALTNLAAARSDAGEDVLRLAAGGFKDMTRIAAGSPDLWAGICLDNRDALIRGLSEYAEQLARFATLLATGDTTGVREWLERAAEVRRALPAQWVPASEHLSVLSVPVTDRPGMVGAVTQAAARAGCNIEDIEIDHTSEDSAVLRLVLTDEGDFDELVQLLEGEGFEADMRPLETEGP